jgi:hypothetical protein
LVHIGFRLLETDNDVALLDVTAIATKVAPVVSMVKVPPFVFGVVGPHPFEIRDIPGTPVMM